MMLAPRPYQIDGAAFLAQRSAALLADEPGLGKTPQAILAADDVGARHVLVVCPASVVENWRREIARWRKGSWTFRVTSYDRARQTDELDLGLPDTIILDEAHYLKNRSAKRTKAIFGEGCRGGGLISCAERVWLLTGTPMPNNPSELWPMLRALMPDAIRRNGRPMDAFTFTQRYCVVRNNGFGLEIVKGKNLDELAEKVRPFMLRRRKREVAKDLPPISFDFLPVKAQQAALALRKLEASAEGDRLRRALEKDDPKALAEVAPHVAQLRRMIGLAKVGPIVEWCKDWFDAGGGKLVLFAHHRDVLQGLTNGLVNYGALVVDGARSQAERQVRVDAFQTGDVCRVFIGQLQAAGTGITLTASSNLVFVETSWVPAENEQVAMRVHRIGQTEPVMIRVTTLVGSLDEQIQAAVERKLRDIREVIG